MMFQTQMRVRDESRPRRGLIRARELTMKEAHGRRTDSEDLDTSCLQMYAAYQREFSGRELGALAVEAGTGTMAEGRFPGKGEPQAIPPDGGELRSRLPGERSC
jgi:prolyl-tRNA synthetase